MSYEVTEQFVLTVQPGVPEYEYNVGPFESSSDARDFAIKMVEPGVGFTIKPIPILTNPKDVILEVSKFRYPLEERLQADNKTVYEYDEIVYEYDDEYKIVMRYILPDEIPFAERVEKLDGRKWERIELREWK